MAEEGRERYGTAAAVSWMRARSRVLAKKRQQGVGFVPLHDNEEDADLLSDEEDLGLQLPAAVSTHEEASMIARQDLQVRKGRALEDSDLKKVWCVLKKRDPQGGSLSQEDSAIRAWISPEEEEEVYEDIEDYGETNVLVDFLQANRIFRNAPASQLRWLADKLYPEEVAPRQRLESSYSDLVAEPVDAGPFRQDSPGSPRGASQTSSLSSRLLQQARELGATRTERAATAGDGFFYLRFLVHGQADWRRVEGPVSPGMLLIDLGPFLPAWFSWRPSTQDPDFVTKCFMASVKLDPDFIERLGEPLQLAAERAAAFFVASKPPTIRSVSDVAMLVQYLRRAHVLAQLTNETLEAVAFALQVKNVQQDEVLTRIGEEPKEVLLPLSAAVCAWRQLPEGASLASHAQLSEETLRRARLALQDPGLRPKPSARPQRMSARLRHPGGTAAEISWPWMCVDITHKDHLVSHTEWAMAAGCPCNVSLVSKSRGKVFALPKSDYQRHVQMHRPAVALEVAVFLVDVLMQYHKSGQDSWWLEETPLARSAVMRVLPCDVRQKVLNGGHIRKLPARSWLCREDDLLHCCFLLLSGELELHLAGTASDQEKRVLPRGTVFGDLLLCSDAPEEGWASRYCAASEDCLLFEVSKQTFKAALGSIEGSGDFKASELEIALQVPVRARTFPQLQLLSNFLERQPEYGKMDSFARMEICEWVEWRSMRAGEELQMSTWYSCVILRGEVTLAVQQGDQKVQVVTMPTGSLIGEEVGMSGDFLLLTSTGCSLLWIDKSQLPQGKVGATSGGDRQAAAPDKAAVERSRAIQTLRFKAPEQRSPQDVALLVKLFHGNKFFDEQEDSVLREICRSMSYMEVKQHGFIIKQDDVADMCYVLLRGSVGVWVNGSGGDEEEAPENESPSPSPGSPKTKPEEGGEAEPGPVSSMSLNIKGKLQKAAVKLLARGGGALQNLPEGNETEEAVENEENPGIDKATGGPINATRVKELQEGTCFGETGLLHGALRNASIVAAEACQLGAITKSLFETKLRAAYLAREQRRADFLREHLPKTGSTADHAQVLGGFFSEHHACRGHVLCTSGRPCERLTIIRDGLCKVRLCRDGRSQEIGEIGKGQVIGLSAIGDMEVEPYTVVCASPEVFLLRMDGADARNRIPADLREGIITMGLNMMARMQSRADFLKVAQLGGESVQVLLSGSEDPDGKGAQRLKLPKARAEAQNGRPGARTTLAAARARTAPSSMPKAPKAEIHDAPHRRQLQRLMERQQREWEDLVTKPSQWSPNMLAEKQREKDRLKKQLHSRRIKTDRLLKENAVWQHEKHLTLTCPEMCEKASCRRISGEIRDGFFIPGPVQTGHSDANSVYPVWFPSSPPHEVLKPSLTAPPPLQRVMTVAVSPPLRAPRMSEEEEDPDTLLCCSPLFLAAAPCARPTRPSAERSETSTDSHVIFGRAGDVDLKDGQPWESATLAKELADSNPFFILHEQQYTPTAEAAPMLLSAKSSPRNAPESPDVEAAKTAPAKIRAPRTPRTPRPQPGGVGTERRKQLLRARKGPREVAVRLNLSEFDEGAPGQTATCLRKFYHPDAVSVSLGAEEIALLKSREAEEDRWQQELQICLQAQGC